MYKLYGIANCDTVKRARVYLEKQKIDFTFIDFKKSPPSTADIQRWSRKFGSLPVNAKGQTYKKYKDEYESLSASAKSQFLTEHSSMIKRPILERKDEVLAFGFAEELYQNLFT